MGWDESVVMGVLVLLLIACELAACTALAVILVRAVWGWSCRKRRATLERVQGFEVKLADGAPRDATSPASQRAAGPE